MSNVHQFNSKDLILEKSCDWISAIDRGLTDDEKEQFKLWMMQSTAHQDSIYELAQLWDELSVLNELSHLFPQRNNTKTSKNTSMIELICGGLQSSITLLCVFF